MEEVATVVPNDDEPIAGTDEEVPGTINNVAGSLDAPAVRPWGALPCGLAVVRASPKVRTAGAFTSSYIFCW